MEAAFLGSLGDEGSGYSVYSQPAQKIAAGSITLSEALHGPRKVHLKLLERYRIALAIASSHLQLQSTPWARTQWQAEDIRFPVGSSSNCTPIFDRPYVAAEFGANATSAKEKGKSSKKSFSCLGVMLLELHAEHILEDHKLWQSLPGLAADKTNALYRSIVATQWAKELEGETVEDYIAAVNWCLNESPETLDGDNWRKYLADKVVLPLQYCCKSMTNSHVV